MNTEIVMMTANALLAAYRAAELSPVEVTEAVLKRIDTVNPALNAFNVIDAEGALTAARESEERWRLGAPRGRLDGCPASVKDILLTRGWPTLRGSKATDPAQDWTEDAPSVARLKEHGAVILGKTTTPEFGWKGVTDSPVTGITRNPWNPGKTPGGSSGGAAAALAAGMGPLALGTDGGGSIRIPAAFTGTYGIKPSFGRVPAYPLSPFGTVSHVGPMTRSVDDAALLLSVLAEPDPRDAYSLPYDATDYMNGLNDGIEGLKVAYAPSLGGHMVDAEVAALVAKAAWSLADLGAEVELAEPDFSGADAVFRCLWYAGAANLMRRFDAAAQAQMDPGFREIAEDGARYSLLDYLEAVARREAFIVEANRFHGDYDLLLTPALPLAAFEAGLEVPAESGMTRWPDWTPFSYPFNLTQQPAAALPCGLTIQGLPVALQIVGPRYADALVLRASRAFEAAHPWRFPDLGQTLTA